MGRAKDISYDEKVKIIFLHQQGASLRQIAVTVHRSVSGVKGVIDSFKLEGTISDCRVVKRASKTSNRDKKYLFLTSKRDRRKSVPILTEEINQVLEYKISQSSVRRVLSSFGMNGRVACKKPWLRPANITKRLKFAMQHVNWTEEQWENVLFTDETKIEVYGSHRRVFVRRMAGERYQKQCLVPTVKFGGGSIMVWGAVSGKGKLPLHKIEGKMTKETYHQILIRKVKIFKALGPTESLSAVSRRYLEVLGC